ncbi:MAG: thiolase domain-containing protein [Thermoproteota archaeon]|nr:thiolase domain-containing protein [Candidatus Brockarchaeota archaeon]MBO3768259.1 thiolase domain-containing protein [Candidatus Brockarchaeota archaeon]MBO3802120.1 thiolase domain-containing protein [Candidatus Brockarchaeota archaeon]
MKPIVAGVGMTKVGEQWSKSLKDLALEASLEAIDSSNLIPEVVVFSNMMSGRLQAQDHLGTLLVDELGLRGLPAVRVEAACASGGAAFHVAYNMIKSGLYNIALVVGAEKMSDTSTEQTTTALMTAEDREYTGFYGASFVSLNALAHRLYMERFNVSEEEMASLAVLSHENGINNPFAMYRKKISIKEVLESPYVADPIHLLEAAPTSDGAAAVILASEEVVKSKSYAVSVEASTMATDTIRYYEREDLLTFESAKKAFANAISASKIEKTQIDIIELHDAFTIVGYLTLESTNIVERGKAAKLIANNKFSLSDKPSVNTMGGLKSRGHPIGATGLFQIAEIYLQLTNNAGKNQVDNAKVGVAFNVGGVGTTTSVSVLKRR